jgi:hypothetical protein
MSARRLARRPLAARAILLAAIVMSGAACVGTGEKALPASRIVKPGESIHLAEAEEMIDGLDHALTSYGTIGVKTPDVWGQDRLAKFRCEYEAQMSEWLRAGFKADINASIRRGETNSTLIRVGTSPVSKGANAPSSTPAGADDDAQLQAVDQARAALDAALPASNPVSSKPSASLEPSVVLDEHSNYLNHLNQLRRINAGDDLTDRPGYGLYLVRIPVTISPGPRSRCGKGAIITVSARPVMTRHTLRTAMRNVVINETVNHLTQAICHQNTDIHDQPAAPSAGPFSLVSFADTELYYGRDGIARLTEETRHQLAKELGDEPHHRNARVAEWLRGELESSYHLLEQAATPVRSPEVASVIDPLEEIGESLARRDFTRIAQLHARTTDDPGSSVPRPGARARRRADAGNAPRWWTSWPSPFGSRRPASTAA